MDKYLAGNWNFYMRAVKNLPTILPTLHTEIRRRLWYTILELVVQSSLDARMPPRISWDDFDTEIPSNVNDDELRNMEAEIQWSPRSRFTDTSTQLALIDSPRKHLHIVQLLNGLILRAHLTGLSPLPPISWALFRPAIGFEIILHLPPFTEIC